MLFAQSVNVAVSTAVIFFSSVSLEGILIIALLFVLFLNKRCHSASWSTTDIGVACFTILQSCLLPHFRFEYNVTEYGVVTSSAGCVYFLVRYGYRNLRSHRVALLLLCTVIGLAVGCADLFLEITRYQQWRALHFTELVAFRAFFPLVGGSTKNDCLALCLCLMANSLTFAVTSKHFIGRAVGVLSTFLLTLVVLFGLSRAAWLGLLAFTVLSVVCFASGFRSEERRLPRKGLVLIGVIAVLALPWLHQSIANTSQRRSTLGRLQIWKQSVPTIKEHPLVGVGGYNGAKATLRHGQPPDTPFTSQVYNLELQLLIQNGFVGLLCFSCIIIGVTSSVMRCYLTHGRQFPAMMVGFVAGVGSLFVADLFYSSIALYPPVTFLFFALVGAIESSVRANRHAFAEPRVHEITSRTKLPKLIPLMFCLSATYALLHGLRSSERQKAFQSARGLVQAGDIKAALKVLNATELDGDCDELYQFSKALAEERIAGVRFQSDYVSKTSSTQPRVADPSSLQPTLEMYDKSVLCMPQYAIALHNRAWTLLLTGDAPAAEKDITAAISLPHGSALYLVAAGLFANSRLEISRADQYYARALAARPSLLESPFFRTVRGEDPNRADHIIQAAEMLLQSRKKDAARDSALGTLFYLTGDMYRAEQLSLSALTVLPTLSEAWITIGRIRENEGSLIEAKLDFQRALFLAPNVAAFEGLGRVASSMGEMEEARIALQNSLYVEEQSESANLNFRLFRRASIFDDDVSPQGLLAYIGRPHNAEYICEQLQKISVTKGVSMESEIQTKLFQYGVTCVNGKH